METQSMLVVPAGEDFHVYVSSQGPTLVQVRTFLDSIYKRELSR